MEKIKVGFIGCGGIAQYHFGHFEKMRDKAQIVAACDKLQDRAERTAQRFEGAKVYTDYHTMFESEKLDAVFICVEPSAHIGMEFEAIDKGVNIFCQKPMSLDIKYAEKVLKGIKKNKLISACGFQCRYADSLDFVRSFVGKKIKNNDIAMVSAYRIGGFPMVWWWRSMKDSGGQVVEQAIHNYDLCRYIFGEVEQVEGIRRRGVIRNIEGMDADDASSVILKFKNGIIGTFNTGCFGGGEGNINAYWANGKISYGIGGDFTITEPNSSIKGKAGNDYGQECTETFIDAVRGDIDREEILSPYEDGIKSLKLVLGVNQSMDNDGMPVKL